MSNLVARPFYVLDKAYVIWGANGSQENLEFIKQIDCSFYHRSAELLISEGISDPEPTEQDRKSIASLSRILWHNATETLTMLIGSLIQSPHAVDGFFLKCNNERCREVSRKLSSGNFPKGNLWQPDLSNIKDIIKFIFDEVDWEEKDKTSSNFTDATKDILRDYNKEHSHSEYNCLKHGLRLSHNAFEFSFGIEQQYEDEQTAHLFSSRSRDGSHFRVVSPLPESRQTGHFYTKEISIGWSLERTLMQLQFISCLARCVCSKLQILNGVAPTSVKFERPVPTSQFWEIYHGLEREAINNFTIDPKPIVPKKVDPAAKMADQVYGSLRKQTKTPH